MSIKTKKKIRTKNFKKKSLKGGSPVPNFNQRYGASLNYNLPGMSGMNNKNLENVSSEGSTDTSPEVIETKIEQVNEKELQQDVENDPGEYYFDEGENAVISQPYGDEVRITLDKDESIYGINMNVISFDTSIKETKTFTPKAKVLGEETFIKKYRAKDRGKIIFDYDKNDPSKYVKEQIVVIALNKNNNNFVVRNPKNVIAYTGNISIKLDFHMTGVRSSKESVIFTKLKLNKSSERGYIWVVMENYDVIEESQNPIKIKNDNFLCATMPKDGFKLHKLTFPTLSFKSTKEYVEVKPPCVVYRTSNNFSNKQLSFLEQYKTNFF